MVGRMRWLFLACLLGVACSQSTGSAPDLAVTDDAAVPIDMTVPSFDFPAPSFDAGSVDASFYACCLAGVSFTGDGSYTFPPVYNYCLDSNVHPHPGTRDAGEACSEQADCVGSWFGTDAGTIAFYLTACENGRCVTPVEACNLDRCKRPSSNCQPIQP